METRKNHMPNCQKFYEFRNLVFLGLWSLLKQNPSMRKEKLYRAKECLNVSFGYLVLMALHIATHGTSRWYTVDSYRTRWS